MRRVFDGLKAFDVSRSNVPGKVPTNLARAEGNNQDASRPPILPGKLAGETPRDGSPAPDSGGASEDLPGRLAGRVEAAARVGDLVTQRICQELAITQARQESNQIEV